MSDKSSTNANAGSASPTAKLSNYGMEHDSQAEQKLTLHHDMLALFEIMMNKAELAPLSFESGGPAPRMIYSFILADSDLAKAGLDVNHHQPRLQHAIAELADVLFGVLGEQAQIVDAQKSIEIHYDAAQKKVIIPFPNVTNPLAFTTHMENNAQTIRQRIREQVHGQGHGDDALGAQHPKSMVTKPAISRLVNQQMQLEHAGLLRDCLTIITELGFRAIRPHGDQNHYAIVCPLDWKLHSNNAHISIKKAFSSAIKICQEQKPELGNIQIGFEFGQKPDTKPTCIGFISSENDLRIFKSQLDRIADTLKHQLGIAGVSSSYMLQ